ncbi:MAG: CHAD domain-containing protein [Phycisphaeraceae bacterium]|nr:CHAD domain-containing protein [Phycisphaeraceae bacterium]
MTYKTSKCKWVKGLRPDMAVAAAARRVFTTRLDAVGVLLKLASSRSHKDPEYIHQLRVATRRAEAAVEAFEPALDRDTADKALRRLKKIRRAAGDARDSDVHLARLREARDQVEPSLTPLLDHLIAITTHDRSVAQAEVVAAAKKHSPARLRRLGRALVESATQDRRPEATGVHRTLAAVATGAIETGMQAFVSAAEADLSVIDNLHSLRLVTKRLRYVVELFGTIFDRKLVRAASRGIARIQEKMGSVNDAHQELLRLEAIAARLDRSEGSVEIGLAAKWTPQLRAGLASLIDQRRGQLSHQHDQFLGGWNRTGGETLLDDLRAIVRAASAEFRPLAPQAGARPGPPAPPEVVVLADVNRVAAAAGSVPPASPLTPDHGGPIRIAAIDVGTNSIRLIIAEAAPDGSYRVLDDEKEIARLGRGIDATGRLDDRAMMDAAVAITRMRTIADGYGVAALRVVGTAAVREASNRDEFLDRVRSQAGVELQVVGAEEEARLAYLSASNAVDLSAARSAVVDIGGGSTEVILSAPANPGSVIERIYTIPQGAVRLTERFGGPEQCAGPRFDEMRKAVRKDLDRHIGSPQFLPLMLIGTGGTITTLASMVLHANLGPAADGLFAGSVQGHEVRRFEVRHLLDNLRKTPLRERARTPGLSADRADIIVAGLTIVDCVMRHLEIDVIKAHEGGIRDGLLLTMVQDAFPHGTDTADARDSGGRHADPRDPLRSVRRFARACGYEHRHCTHVARLALQIFDQLAAVGDGHASDLSPRHRVLLEAAALVHDVGYLINYARHHKHSYHLIVHADLPGFSAREVEIIAHLARYHRRAEPKGRHRSFARLPKEDRRTVRALAAILRIADGLDRTHTQRVQGVRLSTSDGQAIFTVEADPEPTVDIWGAQRKCSLLTRAFGLQARFEWAAPPSEIQPDPTPVEESRLSGSIRGC